MCEFELSHGRSLRKWVEEKIFSVVEVVSAERRAPAFVDLVANARIVTLSMVSGSRFFQRQSALPLPRGERLFCRLRCSGRDRAREHRRRAKQRADVVALNSHAMLRQYSCVEDAPPMRDKHDRRRSAERGRESDWASKENADGGRTSGHRLREG
jgi:hypothetical protein